MVGDTAFMRISALMAALVKDGSRKSHAVLASLANWAALHIERYVTLRGLDPDPLKMPHTKGRKRTRRIHRIVKAAVSAEANTEGRFARSEAHVLAMVKRLGKFGLAMRARDGNKWGQREVATYFNACVAAWKAVGWQFLHAAGDSTRLGGRDTFHSVAHWFAGRACRALPKVCAG